jgi:methylglutaconyl-CoA hydratase
MSSDYETIRVERDGPTVRVTLNRPEVRNAFNATMLQELTQAFEGISTAPDIRAVVITGEGKAFCAGADLHWMGKVKQFTYEENVADSMVVANLMRAMYACPKPVVGRINGAAIGGGTGFVAVCDIVVASDRSVFSFSEVKIGLVPACIAPFVLKRVGESRGREYFLSGERLTPEKAEACGLANKVVPHDELDDAVNHYLESLITSGPNALSVCKQLIREVADLDLDRAGPRTAELLADVRMSDEGQEGMAAFLGRRKPRWIPE